MPRAYLAKLPHLSGTGSTGTHKEESSEGTTTPRLVTGTGQQFTRAHLARTIGGWKGCVSI